MSRFLELLLAAILNLFICRLLHPTYVTHPPVSPPALPGDVKIMSCFVELSLAVILNQFISWLLDPLVPLSAFTVLAPLGDVTITSRFLEL